MLGDVYGGFHLFLNNLFWHQSQPNLLFCPTGPLSMRLSGQYHSSAHQANSEDNWFFPLFLSDASASEF